MPFDLKSAETILFLLIVAPVLEELLFRFAYMIPFEKKGIGLAALTAVSATLFSISHLNALRYVPADFYSFVIFQGAYTFLLGISCYLGKQKFDQAITFPIILHFAFNFGFYLSSNLI